MHKVNFYGSATVGTKGQVVIPLEARKRIGVKTGDKLIVLGMGEQNMLALCTVESVESMLSELDNKLKTIRQVVSKNKKDVQL